MSIEGQRKSFIGLVITGILIAFLISVIFPELLNLWKGQNEIEIPWGYGQTVKATSILHWLFLGWFAVVVILAAILFKFAVQNPRVQHRYLMVLICLKENKGWRFLNLSLEYPCSYYAASLYKHTDQKETERGNFKETWGQIDTLLTQNSQGKQTERLLNMLGRAVLLRWIETWVSYYPSLGRAFPADTYPSLPTVHLGKKLLPSYELVEWKTSYVNIFEFIADDPFLRRFTPYGSKIKRKREVKRYAICRLPEGTDIVLTQSGVKLTRKHKILGKTTTSVQTKLKCANSFPSPLCEPFYGRLLQIDKAVASVDPPEAWIVQRYKLLQDKPRDETTKTEGIELLYEVNFTATVSRIAKDFELVWAADLAAALEEFTHWDKCIERIV